MPQHTHRVLPLQGASNFRDLGGYRGHGGRTLRWRRLFRSEHLAGLTDADHATLAALGLNRSLDFRGKDERAAVPYAMAGLAQHSLAIEPTVAQRMDEIAAAGQALTAEVAADLMRELYRGMVNDQAHRFAELFQHLLQADSPLVFHCTAGKDRTGLAAAFILLALGVEREVVLQDYLLTNALYKHPPFPPSATPREALAVMWGVQASFLLAALQTVDDEHGGIDRYLRERLGLDASALDALAARYLQA